MSSSDVTGNPRHDILLQYIAKHGYMSLEELADFFGVSTQTIRRDIRKLSNDGYISRYRGGAGPVATLVNVALEKREVSWIEEKEAIAQTIAHYIPDNSTVFITIGTTVEFIAKALATKKKLRVITNSIRVAHILYKYEQIESIIPPGSIRYYNGGIIGPDVIDFIKGFRADYMITSMGAIDPDGSILEFNVDEGAVAKTMIAHARHVFLAADHSKFLSSASIDIGNLCDATALFTDEKPAARMIDLMKKHYVELYIVKRKEDASKIVNYFEPSHN